jgi:hypothetical protein
VNLAARSTHAAPDWCAVGVTVHAAAPTCTKPIIGLVTEVDGIVVTLQTSTGMFVAVDVEDCQPHEGA